MSYVLEYKFYFIYPREYRFICHWLINIIISIILFYFYFIGKCCVICSGKYNFMCYWRILFHMILEVILFHMSLVNYYYYYYYYYYYILFLLYRKVLCYNMFWKI